VTLKVVERDGHVTVTCNGETVTIAGHLVGAEEDRGLVGSGGTSTTLRNSSGLTLPGGTDTFVMHVGLPTEHDFSVGTKVRLRPALRRMVATKDFQDLVKLSGEKPMVLVVKRGGTAAKSLKLADKPFATLHEEFKLK
jgi:hypothetical protein